MATIEYVTTREGLKAAMNSRYDYIVVTNKELAKEISTVKNSSEAVLKAVIVAAGVTTAFWWNPAGWLTGAVAVTYGGALVAAVAFLIVVLGASILWALYKEWKIVARGRLRLPDGSTIDGEIILSPN